MKKIRKKSHNAKKTNGDPLVSPGFVCYAEKKEKAFLVQFPGPTGTIWRRLKFL